MASPSPTAPRPRLLRLPASDLDRAWDDPGLAAMAAEGWTVAHAAAAVDRDVQVLVVLLWPPARPAGTDLVRWAWAPGWSVLAVAAAVASIVASVFT